MIGCVDCQQYFAEIDGRCALCRSLQRLTVEARRVSPPLRGWVVDQTRIWIAILQEEEQKWERAKAQEEARLAAAAATSKAISPVVAEAAGTEGLPQAVPGPAKVEPGTEEAVREGEVSPGVVSTPSEEKEEEVAIEEEEKPPVPVKEEPVEPAGKKKEKKKKDKDRPEVKEEVAKEEKKVKKEKNPKKKRKSRSRSRRMPRSRSRRRARSDRSSRSRSRRSPRKGDQGPPEPRSPPRGWQGSSGQHGFYSSSHRSYPEEGFERWGKNKGTTKRKKQQEWRNYNDYYYYR